MKKTKNYIYGILLLAVLSTVMLVTYKGQIAPELRHTTTASLYLNHKTTGSITLSQEMPVFSETFLCTVPKLKSLAFQCSAAGTDPAATLSITISDPDSGTICYSDSFSVAEHITAKKKLLKVIFPKKLKDSADKLYTITFALENAGSTGIVFTANPMFGIVQDDHHINIIYQMHYGTNQFLCRYFIIIAAISLFMTALCYYLLIVRRRRIRRAFFPICITMGILISLIFIPHGTPDETNHIYTAYRYSNIMTFTPSADEGFINMRTCDAILNDMLANDIESNSYYQLMTETWIRPSDTDLIPVAYDGSSQTTLGFAYIPAAIGISLGRLLGLSAMLTLYLGRFCSLFAYTYLCLIALSILPYAHNVFGMVMLLTISIQQAMSISYDPVILGCMFIYIALCLKLAADKEHIALKELISLLILCVLVALSKGGVYMPLLLLLLLVCRNHPLPLRNRNVLIGSVCGLLAVITVFIIKYIPILSHLLSAPADASSTYTLRYCLAHPANVLYIFFNTLLWGTERHLKALLGCKLAWESINGSWCFAFVILIGLLTLTQIKEEQMQIDRTCRTIFLIASVSCILLIMASMLFAFTPTDAVRIAGVQGRYYLGFFPIMLLCTPSDRIAVKKKCANPIMMTMLFTEVLICSQVLPQIF